MTNQNIVINGCKFEASPFGPPASPGVYLVAVTSPLTHKKRIFYVGSSKNIRNRVSNFKHPYYIIYQRLSHLFWVCTESYVTNDYLELERDVIKQLNPILNKVHNKKNG